MEGQPGPQLTRLAEAIDDRYRAMILPAGRTGLRFGDAETVEALKLHRKRYGNDPVGQVFTTPGGARGPGGTLNARNFQRIWAGALQQTGLDIEFGFKTVTRRFKRDGKLITGQVQAPKLTFHGLRHTTPPT